ncbi:universal stress protein [Streptomyces sp. NBC_01020]|uniref:universal stress protein n=1 Tax=unclassified Streptomyces TaxID=2593676 RepID=UPI00225AA7D5|nr:MULTISPECIES: universal stress protein [unclassified Streptomyces]MCX4722786.1 universal stress protein [Streptomyces sp. NBC_01306]WSV07555.1 universal stress protein [Streptomyces sp. NBC_01020]WSX66278.1 universal stress protein [Streptomyces sp. NBC_00932]
MNAVVTVGLDGTPESLSAALWAAQEASARGATLRLLHAWVMLAPEGDAQQSENDPNYWPKRIVSDARDAIGQRFPDLRVYEDLVAREPMDALLEAATESQTLVLGSRALSSLTGYFLGDIGMHVLARAEVPTVLVRAGEDTAPITEDGDVVLGLSLRRPCDELIEYAFDAAIRRDSTLRVVHGRNLPPSAYNRGGLDPYLSHELTREAQQDLTRTLSPWRGRFPDVRVVESVQMESPARAVVRDIAGTGLLVVGRRVRHRPFPRRIGHVPSAAVHHAPCPVAVVPHT